MIVISRSSRPDAVDTGRKLNVHKTLNLRPVPTGEVFCKKVYLEISQNSQQNTCAMVSFLIKF